MKKYILISLLLILNPLNGFTQETHIIEPAELEVIYSTQENFRWDKYALRCGRNTSQYFSISRLGFLKMMASKDDVAVLADMKQSLEDLNITDPRKKKKGTEHRNERLYLSKPRTGKSYHLYLYYVRQVRDYRRYFHA